MPGPARVYRNFAASTRGVAAIEFAVIMPVLLLMFLASFDAGRAITIYMKVRSTTFTVGAITNQYTTIQSSDMQAIVGASSAVLAPYSSAPAVVTISQIKVSSGNQATVSWSYSLNGAARAQGSSVTLPGSLVTSTLCGSYPCYLILSEVSYQYTPSFGYFLTGPIKLSDSLYVTPRSSACILYPPEGVNSPSNC